MTALATADSTANAPVPVPFAFESHQIRTVMNDDGIPWFVAKDICAALTIPWRGETLRAIPDDWKRVGKLPTRCDRDAEFPHPKKGGLRGAITVISEPAVYKLAFRSNKPEADRFTNWVASEVIPTLRRRGKYEVCPTTGTLTSSRLTTAKERNALTTLVNRYVGMLPGGPHQEAYKAAWRKVHEVMGIGSIEELTVEQLPRAVLFMKSLVDAPALAAAEPAPLKAVLATAGMEREIEWRMERLRAAKLEMMDHSTAIHQEVQRAVRTSRTALGSNVDAQMVQLSYGTDELFYGLDRSMNAIENLGRAAVLAVRALSS